MAWSAFAATEPDHAQVNRVLAEAVIIPAYERYHQDMQDLAPVIDALCVVPGGAGEAGDELLIVGGSGRPHLHRANPRICLIAPVRSAVGLAESCC